jgi:hypothetical protein
VVLACPVVGWSPQLSFGVPESALAGHAFHTYTLTSPDGRSVNKGTRCHSEPHGLSRDARSEPCAVP